MIIGIIVSLFIVIFFLSVIVYFMFLFEDDFCKEFILNDIWLWVVFVFFIYFVLNFWVYGLRYRELRYVLK